MSELQELLRAEMHCAVDLSPDGMVDARDLAFHLERVLTERFAILPLPEGDDRRDIRGESFRRWELPHDQGVVTAHSDGYISEGTSGNWNVARGDDVLAFAAALVAAARYASGEARVLDSIRRGEQDVKDGNLTDLDDIAGGRHREGR